MKKRVIYVFMIFALTQCNKKSTENSESIDSTPVMEQTESTDDEISTDVITNNSSASQPDAANNEPKFQFEEESWDFGTITDGEQVSHTFKFKNIGKGDLVISSASASCGCTVPKHTKEPVAPGKTGEIAVTFNSAGKGQGVPITKDVTIIANTNPVQSILKITATVLPATK
jgi:hypothetical protein